LIDKAKLTSGGGVTKAIDELLLSGFIGETDATGERVKDSLMRLTDEFSLFYWHWMRTDLQRKLRVFGNRSNRRSTLFLTMVTKAGLKPNPYSHALVTNEVTLSDLFRLTKK
jgi:hypothetical protein